jgi:hypothetical protein
MHGTSGPHYFGGAQGQFYRPQGDRKSLINSGYKLTCIGDSRPRAVERWMIICLKADRAVDELRLTISLLSYGTFGSDRVSDIGGKLDRIGLGEIG